MPHKKIAKPADFLTLKSLDNSPLSGKMGI